MPTQPAIAGPDEMRAFRCNVCGTSTASRLSLVTDRESPSCSACGSNRRFRTIVHGLSSSLFGASIALPDFPVVDRIVGVGLSDALVYATPLAAKLRYTNTFFDTEPRFDIRDIAGAPYRDLDFLIASDVFEHVAPPIDLAFANARRLLRRGGTFVFSVPYGLGHTVEHFPNLFDYRLDDEGGTPVLVNTTATGAVERHEHLVFHGGPGSTLEMRVFGLRDIRRLFRDHGFSEPRLLDGHAPEFGIEHAGEVCSLPMVAKAVG